MAEKTVSVKLTARIDAYKRAMDVCVDRKAWFAKAAGR